MHRLVQSMSLEALGRPEYIQLYRGRFTHFNPIQTQASNSGRLLWRWCCVRNRTHIIRACGSFGDVVWTAYRVVTMIAMHSLVQSMSHAHG
jgi:hypothetical protein